jgi:hypothetical protein
VEVVNQEDDDFLQEHPAGRYVQPSESLCLPALRVDVHMWVWPTRRVPLPREPLDLERLVLGDRVRVVESADLALAGVPFAVGMRELDRRPQIEVSSILSGNASSGTVTSDQIELSSGVGEASQ